MTFLVHDPTLVAPPRRPSEDEAMEMIRRVCVCPATLAVFPGTFNPPTRAHLALAKAALREADEVLFVLPKAFPHKGYEGASFQQRLQLLREAVFPYSRFSVGASSGGLFLEIAREIRECYPANSQLLFLCGRDAAERIVNWDYGDPGALSRMLVEFQLLVANRAGEYEAPREFASRIRALPVGPGCDEVSATTVRERIASGGAWQELVPPHITELVEKVYRARKAPVTAAGRADLR